MPTLKQNREHVKTIFDRLNQEYPAADISLDFENPLQLLVSVILSAQCTDERVRKVTKDLFKKYKSAEDYVNVPHEELAEDIKSCGYYNNKAKWIQGACKKIIEEFDGEVPKTLEEVQTLPGVGKKTGSIVVMHAYDNVEGFPVDTHVRRLAWRLGLTRHETNRDKISEELEDLVPHELWKKLDYLLIEHGRAVCKAPTPTCSKCVLADICPKNGVENAK